MNNINRRLFLKMASAGVTMFWPTIKMARAQSAAEIPKVMVTVRNSNGVPRAGWETTMRNGRLNFGDTLAALQGNADYVTFLSNLEGSLRSAHRRANILLGGLRNLGARANSRPSNITADYVLSEILKRRFPDVPHPLLCVGVPDGNKNVYEKYTDYSRITIGGSEENPVVIDPIIDMQVLFDEVFGGFTSPDNNMGMSDRAKKQSVLSVVKKGLSNVSGLSRSENSKIQDHMDRIREIEARLQRSPSNLGLSSELSRPEKIEPFSNDGEEFEKKLDIAYDIITAAAATRQAMVITLDQECGQGRTVFSQAGVRSGHHSASHGSNRLGGDHQKIQAFFGKKLNDFINRFKNHSEEGGNLLRNSLIYYINTIGLHGSTHNIDEMPFLLLGNAGGALRSGRIVDCSRTSDIGMLFNVFSDLMLRPEERFDRIGKVSVSQYRKLPLSDLT